MLLIGIIEKAAMEREQPSMARTRVSLPPTSGFDQCDVCARKNLRGRGSDIFFSERGIASKPLPIPFQPFCSLD